MYKVLLMLIILLLPVSSWAKIEVSHSSDYTRILEQGSPKLVEEAVVGLLGTDGKLPWKSLSTVLPRVGSISGRTRAKVAESLRHRTLDTRAVSALEQMTYDDDLRVQRAAVKSLIKGNPTSEVLLVLERILPVQPEEAKSINRRIEQIKRRLSAAPDLPRAVKPPVDPLWRKFLIVCFSVLSGILGVMLFLWGFRLVNLHRLVNGLPRARIASAPMGMVVIRGEAQPYLEGLLLHPVSHEPCLYYPGADKDHPDHRFWIVDGGGRMLVDPCSAVFISEDGILVPGEGIQLLGDIQHAQVHGKKRSIIGKRKQQRHHLERLFHFIIQDVLGRVFREQSSKALFSDPNSCFWIWDNLEAKPLASTGQLQGLFGVFVLTGSWILLMVVAVLLMI